ncbi:MAG: outer membrane lipoprotein chaperone LolA [Rhodocyclaceae bacterium]
MNVFRIALLALLPLLSSPLRAGGIEQLRAFLEGARTGKAAFSQTVISKSGRTPQKASGSLLFARPGKFRWTYDKPYYQLIVGDGEKLWVYDKDLNQVTVKKLGAALGASPAALLSGDKAWDEKFVLKNAGQTDGLEWLEATPKAEDGTFTNIRIGLSGNLPRTMELQDNFGQVTLLNFEKFERNAAVDEGQFRFVPPKGADVVGE